MVLLLSYKIKALSLLHFQVISITVCHLVLLCAQKRSYKDPFQKSHAELAVKQLSRFCYQRNAAFKFTRIETSGSLRLGKC